MIKDSFTGNLIGVGEQTTFSILKSLTLLKPREQNEYPKSGIYRQIPLKWIIHRHDFAILSDEHKKGSVDILLVDGNKRIAVRVQGNGHGYGKKHHGKYSLKNPHKTKHDKVQADLIRKYNYLVDVNISECPNIFAEKSNEQAKKEIISSFKTANVLIPVSRHIQ